MFLCLHGERVFLQMPLRTFAVLFRTSVISVLTAPTICGPLCRNHAPALATTKKTGERKIVRNLAMSRARSLMQFLLYSFKQGRRKDWRKASGEKLVVMFGKSQIRAIGK